jgi:hypothetical protein
MPAQVKINYEGEDPVFIKTAKYGENVTLAYDAVRVLIRSGLGHDYFQRCQEIKDQLREENPVNRLTHVLSMQAVTLTQAPDHLHQNKKFRSLYQNFIDRGFIDENHNPALILMDEKKDQPTPERTRKDLFKVGVGETCQRVIATFALKRDRLLAW